jgi:hypothetical protein
LLLARYPVTGGCHWVLFTIVRRLTEVFLINGYFISGQKALELLLRNAIVASWGGESIELPLSDPAKDRGTGYLAIMGDIASSEESTTQHFWNLSVRCFKIANHCKGQQ